MKAKLTAAVLALCTFIGQTVSLAANYEKYYEFSEDFSSYTAEDSEYLSRENELIGGPNEDKLIGSKNGLTWTSSAFYSGINGEGGIYIEPSNSAIRLRGCNSGYLTTATLTTDADIELAEVTKIHFETDATTRGQGLNLFLSSDQKSFYAFGSRNGEFVDYLGTGCEPYVKRVISNNASVVGTAPYDDGWNGTDSHVSWDITVSDGIISWKAESNNGKVWEGSLSDEMDLIENHKYILAAFGVGDSYGTVKNISFKTGKYYMDGMGEPSPILYKNVIDGKTQNEENVVSFEDTPSVIRRVYARALKNGKIYLSEDGENYDEFDLDSGGWWFNDQNEKLYRYVKTETATNIARLYILSPIEDSETLVVDKGASRTILLFENNANVAAALPWTSSDMRYATITSGGKVTGVKDGVSEISLQRGYRTLKFNLKVSGPMTKAIESGDAEVISAYIATQQAIADNLNNAIKANDRDGVYNFFFGTAGTGVFADLDAVSTDVLNGLSDAEKTEFAARMLTYEDGFTFTDIQSIYDFEKTAVLESYVGKLNNLTSAESAKSALTAHNDYFELPLENDWFTNTEDKNLAALLNTTYKNYSDLYNKFSTALILENLKQTINSEYMSKIITAYSDFIGYDKTHFESVKATAVTALINSKANISSIEDIKNFLDTYAASKPKPTPTPGGGGGGGGGGTSTVVNPYKNLPEKTPETPAPAAEKVQLYPDVSTDYWGYEAIRYLNAKQAISGYEDNTFRPENKITRAEFLTILLGVFVSEEKADDEQTVEAKDVFKDADSGKWYYDTINKAYREGLLQGNGEYCFPEDNITRQEIAVLVMRTLESNGIKIDNSKNMGVFYDEDSIADWAVGSVTKLRAADVINGTDGMFMPISNAARAEAAQIIYNAALAAGK